MIKYLDQLYPFHKCIPVSPDEGSLYKTLAAAKAAANSGEIIVVWPGTYAEGDLLKNGVNWFFLPGATVAPASGTSIFSDGGAVITSKIWGFGSFVVAGDAAVLLLTGGSQINFECSNISAVTGAPSIAVVRQSAASSVYFTTDQVTVVDGDGFLISHASAFLYASIRQLSAPGGIGLDCNNGTVALTIHSADNATDIDISGGTVKGLILSSTSGVVTQTGGTLNLITGTGVFGGAKAYSGAGSPEASQVAAVGSTYLRTSDESFWMKKTGTGNTGWIEIVAGV